ncbi:thrombomodulin-like [Aulostomus maculatus]
MTPTVRAWLVGVVFLCGLEEAVRSQRGYCDKNQCLVLFQEPVDFPGAAVKCRGSVGQLSSSVVDSSVVMSFLRSLGLSGSYWLNINGSESSAEAGSRLQDCPAVHMRTEQNFTFQQGPCDERLDGYVCRYTLEEPCSRLPAGGDTRVTYTAPMMGFEVNSSAEFPQGTLALMEDFGDNYLRSKLLCFAGNWTRAPWICEVLQGGCEHGCNSTTRSCVCPIGRQLHPNNITCGPQAHHCPTGFMLTKDGKGCEVVKCAVHNPCTGEGEECVDSPTGPECDCQEDFVREDGVCVDVSICLKCEHMFCDKVKGVYQCLCRKGFRVSEWDPTKCMRDCTEQDCLVTCINLDNVISKCFCPSGYILNMENNYLTCTDINECEFEHLCPHKCENLFGDYRCVCDEGFKLEGGNKCVSLEGEEDGPDSTPPIPTTASDQPTVVPS